MVAFRSAKGRANRLWFTTPTNVNRSNMQGPVSTKPLARTAAQRDTLFGRVGGDHVGIANERGLPFAERKATFRGAKVRPTPR